MFSRPVNTSTWPDLPEETVPTALSISRIAPAGQSRAHPPQEWHTSSNSIG